MRFIIILVILLGLAFASWQMSRQGSLLTRSVAEVVESVTGGEVSLPGTSSGAGRIYRWRDQNGSLVISDEPPPPGVQAERLDYDRGEDRITGTGAARSDGERDAVSGARGG